MFLNNETIRPDNIFDVHGGLTYSGGGENSNYPVESDLWWFGYDCIHAGDARDLNFLPSEVRIIEEKFFIEGTVKTLEYCVSECESLVNQIIEFIEV